MKKFIVAVVAACVAVGAFAESTDDYVQDGLVACWDGYENDGADGHATELAEWKDTTGTYSFVFNANSGITVNGAALVFTGESGCWAELNADGTAKTFAIAANGTVEVVFKAETTPTTTFVLHSTQSAGITLSRYGSSGSKMKWIVSNKNSPMWVFNANEEVTTAVIQYADGVASNACVNGQVAATAGSDHWSNTASGTTLGSRGVSRTYPFKGEIYAIRLYSTPLTPEQIEANRAVDVKRFVEGNFRRQRPGVSVRGLPQKYATAAGEPRYGLVECAADEAFSMSVPASFVEKGGHKVDCLGWKLYDVATDELIGQSGEQDKLTCEFTYAKPVNLVWQWKVYDMLTIRNFDDDLATVYVNDEPTTNGQQVAVNGSLKLELKDFRNDYYFRYAPESQTDRTLSFDCWEGVPEGYEGENPATFTSSGDITITPNVNVKGYCWTYDNGVIEDCKFRYSCTKTDSSRTISCSSCVTNLLDATERTLTLDAVERVRVDGKNYTITAFTGRPAFEWTYMCEMAIAPRFSTFGYCITDQKYGTFLITNIVGLAEANVTMVDSYAFNYSPTVFKGPTTNFVPRTVLTIGDSSYNGKSGMTGPIFLDVVKTIGSSTFSSCSGLTEAYLLSPDLTKIGGSAFSGCTKMSKVTIGSTNLTSVINTTFASTVTEFVFTGPAPSQTVVGNMVGQMAAKAAKTVRFTVDGSRADWWALAKTPNAEEIAAGLPANCMGVLEDASHNRKAWIVSDKPLDGTLVETDMSKVENEGYTVHTGLALGDELELTAPEGMSQCELQHVEDGVWKTYDTQVGERITYVHGGELTRVVWRIDGVSLIASTTAYNGSLSVEVKSGRLVAGDNIYSRGSEVWVTAVGSAEHPRSTIRRWTGVPAGQETNETVKLVLNEDTIINALFRAVEWVYDPATKKITDGEYTSGARANDLIGEDGMSFAAFSGGQNYELWLDLSIPIYNPDDPTKDYWIAGVTSDRNGSACSWKRVCFGPHIVSMPGAMFWGSANLDEMEHFGQIQVESLANYFFYNYSNGGPIKNRTYEAEDFYPSSLKRIGGTVFCGDSPLMRGKITVGLNNLSNIDQLIGRCSAVTNWIFTAEDLPAISWHTSLFAPTTVTFASTNLTLGANGAYVLRYGDLKDLIFLAHAPSAAVMNTLTSGYLKNTNTVIHCSKYAPGWKELRMKGYTTCPEWDARPEGCWGVYQTDNGKKRFYLVQKNSKYDKRNGFSVILK